MGPSRPGALIAVARLPTVRHPMPHRACTRLALRRLCTGAALLFLADEAVAQAMPQKIRIQVEGHTLHAQLEDSAAARDFASLLPLSLVLEDYAATEKIAMLARRLDVSDAPPASTPQAGDVSYYAPWGNLALFHKPFERSPGLVRLGRIDAGVELLRRPGKLTVRMEAVPAAAP